MIDTPQALVSYPGGTGGEWLAIQIGNHDKYYHERIGSDVDGFNRWRLYHNWRATLFPKFISNFDEGLFDNSPEWWARFDLQRPNKAEWYKIAKQTMKEMDARLEGGTIPVHRSHYGWYDTYWKDMFTDYKTITIKVDHFHKPSVKRVEKNFLKKVLLKELHLTDFKGRDGGVRRLFEKYDILIESIPKAEAIEQAIEYAMPTAETYMQYHHKLDDSWHVLDFKKMFLDKDYFEYLKMCEFLDMQPWTANKWLKGLNEYLLPDETDKFTVQDLRDLLEKHL